MRRRDVLGALAAVATGWPAARAQPSSEIRSLGVLTNLAADDPIGQGRVAALLQGLRQLGWAEGHNLRIHTRWGADDAESSRQYATELLALTPDVFFAATTLNVGALKQITRTVPIVFAGVSDPVGAGLVASLARPGGNITGFSLSEYGVSVKWLELLKEVAPNVTRTAVLTGVGATPGIGQLAAIQAVAPSLRVELTPLVVSDASEIEGTISNFARGTNGGLIVTTGTVLQINRELIVTLAHRYNLPTVYPFRLYATAGGLLTYGADIVDLFRRAASYVDRIFRGDKPAELPVQAPSKYELVVNLKTARALGLTVPPTLLARADEVIE
jgi:putative ABC transport system substrate-binding protein